MNKPATKEPSMDEILSSIRQIIADDDAAVAPRKPPVPAAASPSVQPAPPPRPIPAMAPPPVARREPDPEPLTLTAAQMLREVDDEPATPLSFADILGDDEPAPGPGTDEPQLVDPEDIAFEIDDAQEAEMSDYAVEAEPEPQPAPVMVQPRPIPILPAASIPTPRPAAPPPPRPAPSVARTAPMPDPTLSADMAEKLLEPATDAAVKQNFAKLNGLSMMGSGMTLDALMREMLRPMLKDWLDENLPSLVERMVEKEIARISRGE
jgi:cell pole-organizing protein PopZ